MHGVETEENEGVIAKAERKEEVWARW